LMMQSSDERLAGFGVRLGMVRLNGSKFSECGLGEGGGGVWAEAAQKSALVFHQSTIRFDRFSLQQRAAQEGPRSTKRIPS